MRLIGDVESWPDMRRLRNQMMHEYVEDSSLLTSVLTAADDFVPSLLAAGERILEPVSGGRN